MQQGKTISRLKREAQGPSPAVEVTARAAWSGECALITLWCRLRIAVFGGILSVQG